MNISSPEALQPALNPDKDGQTKLLSFLLCAIVVAGAALRLLQYLANPALYIDEIAIARNVLERDLWRLLAVPLAYDQTAPKAFLLAQKLATTVLGQSDYVLRLFPLICSLLGLFAFRRVAERVLDGFGPAIALALFATALPFLFYAAQVKQYSADVAVAVLLLWLALEIQHRTLSRGFAVWAATAGAAAVWFSQPAVFVLTGLGFVLVVTQHFRPGENVERVRLVLVLTLWAFAVVASTLAAVATMSPDTHEYMRRVWARGLLPLPLVNAIKSLWPWTQLKALFGDGTAAALGYPFPAFYLGLTGVGFWLLWRRRRRLALLIFAPIAVTLLAAAARQYPFIDRLILFLVPSFLLGIAATVEWVRRTMAVYFPRLAAVSLLLIAPALYAMIAKLPVYQMENIKPVLTHLQTERRPGDMVYVFYGAAPAVSYYGAQYGFTENDYMIGACRRGDNRHYIEELDTFRGHERVWVVLTHALPRYREREDILRYLDTIGTRRDQLSVPSQIAGSLRFPAEVFLYDLSDPALLRKASAHSFVSTGPALPNPRFGCDDGPQAMVAPNFLPE